MTRRLSSAAVDGTVQGVDVHGPVPLDVITPLSGSGPSVRVRDPLLVLDRHEFVFALGKFAVVHNAQRQEVAIIGGQQPQPGNPSTKRPTPYEVGEISAMALCGKRTHLAVCRSATREGPATVSIHSLKGFVTSPASSRQRGTKLKTLSFDAAERFVSTTLSTDGKLVCCQCANASWSLVVWDWSRERQIAVSDVHCKVSRVRFNVIDMAQISTSGGNQLKLWTLCEYTLKPFASFKSGDETRSRHRIAAYADHIWLPDDCLVALLDDGSVQLIINGELVQTVQALGSRTKAHCLVSLNNEEGGVMVGGSDGLISSLRVATKLMKASEKEIHLQRRIHVNNTENIYSLGIDLSGSILVCCTESQFGAYDLSNLCLLLGENEILTLSPLSSTPFISNLIPHTLTAAARRQCFSALAKLPNDDPSLLVWSQLDGSECFVSHVFDQHTQPTSIDIHPTGAELIIALTSKVIVFFLLHDAVKIAFEMQTKHVSQVSYSPTGSSFLLAQSLDRVISVYSSHSRPQREPQLLGIYRGVEESIEKMIWTNQDFEFFYTEGGDHPGLRYCRLFSADSSGEVDDAIRVHSSIKTLTKSRCITDLAISRRGYDTHDYVLFEIEKEVSAITKARANAGLIDIKNTNPSFLRAWINGDLSRDALFTGANCGYSIPHDVTILAPGPGKRILLGTSRGTVLVLYWAIGRLNQDGTRNVIMMATQRLVDLHCASITGLTMNRSLRILLSCDARGVILVSKLANADSEEDILDQRRRELVRSGRGTTNFDDVPFHDPTQTFSSVCQPDEVAIYDRNTIELRKLKQMDIDGELQQAKLENEMLNKQLAEQKQRFDDILSTEIRKFHTQAENKQSALRIDLESKLLLSENEREKSAALLRYDAQLARDQYISSMDRIQEECNNLRNELTEARQTICDLKLGSEESETQLHALYEKRLREADEIHQLERGRLQEELRIAKQHLKETLVQMDEDQLTQLTMLSSTVQQEKVRASDQMSNIQGKMAALHQEVKMLLAALNQKDHELEALRDIRSRDSEEIAALKDQIRHEKDHSHALQREKHELLTAAQEQRLIRENLQRLNNVHRSQIELLQKNLLPKERELEQMQQHLNELHSVNQEIVIQANLSDRLRKESVTKARQNEADVKETQELLEHVRNSIVVLQEELGELVKNSVVQDKSAIIGEIMRIHKRLSRQIDALQARDGRVEEISAELHRQNKFLMKNKQHLRHQMELSYQEKHKLVAALSYQNTTLMNELNALRKEKKELERMVKCKREDGTKVLQHNGFEEGSDLASYEFDGRGSTCGGMSSKNTRRTERPRPGSASSRRTVSILQRASTLRPSIRPKSAAARTAGTTQ